MRAKSPDDVKEERDPDRHDPTLRLAESASRGEAFHSPGRLQRHPLTKQPWSRALTREGDGTLGWPEESPFEAVVVTASAHGVPEPLKRQLAIGGRLVIPAGPQDMQELRLVRRTAEDAYDTETHLPVRFVPLVGEQVEP